jgi:hypothetical protein
MRRHMRMRLWLLAVAATACGEPPATIEFVDVTPAHPRIGEIATVRFKLTDYRGVPQAGTSVKFSMVSPVPGVSLTPTMAMSIKGDGTVSTQVVASATAKAVTIAADAGGGKVAVSPPIAFAGTVATSTQLTFQCGPLAGDGSGGIHALGAYDQSRHLIAGVKVYCTAHTGDRNGDGVPGVQVLFYTEAGTIGPSETSLTDVIGNATILYKTSLPLPKEVDPGTFVWNPPNDATHTGEYLAPLWMEPFSWTTNPLATELTGVPAFNANSLQEPRRRDPVRRLSSNTMVMPLNNPRDNLVTMIAVTNGEEGFVDANGNGNFDSGESFDDLTEPFVDSNDNATWDSDERFIDGNNNGVWDGKNGTWDANTYIWRQERILWTGMPYDALLDMEQDDLSPPEPVFGLPRPPAAPLMCRGTQRFVAYIADPWFNSLAQNDESDGCSEGTSTKNVKFVPGGSLTGIAFTYPPLRMVTFGVEDNLPRDAVPGGPPYTCNMAGTQVYEAQANCKFTASPEDGQKAHIPIPAAGTVYNNL